MPIEPRVEPAAGKPAGWRRWVAADGPWPIAIAVVVGLLLCFSGAWRADATANIEMGLGSLTIRVPRGLGVRVTRDGFLSGFHGEGLTKRGNVYYSEGYDSAQHHLEIDLDAALGAVRIVWVDG